MAQIPKATAIEQIRSRSRAEKANERERARTSIKNADGPSWLPPTRR